VCVHFANGYDDQTEVFTSEGWRPWSTVYDVCAVCNNKARDRSEYCTSIKEGGYCPGFGCKNGLTQVLDSGLI
jgi:hypothetical protein